MDAIFYTENRNKAISFGQTDSVLHRAQIDTINLMDEKKLKCNQLGTLQSHGIHLQFCFGRLASSQMKQRHSFFIWNNLNI